MVRRCCAGSAARAGLLLVALFISHACGGDDGSSTFEPLPTTDAGSCQLNPDTLGTETCNGIDDDCDGFIDVAPSGMPLGRACTSMCGQGTERCVSGAWTGCNAPEPVAETCNGMDDDCNGSIDDGISCECISGETRACGSSEGRCRPGVQQCIDGAWQEGCFGAVGPADSEICDNGIDDDCDGQIEEGCDCTPGNTQVCGSSVGACVEGQLTCGANFQWGTTCEGAVAPVAETCNGIDDDCDGEVDWAAAAGVGWRADLQEPSDTCEGAVRLATAVDSGATISVPVSDPQDILTFPNLHIDSSGTDEDWYQFPTEEISHGGCIPLTSQCAFVLVTELSLEAGARAEDYELCVATVDRCSEVTAQNLVCADGDQWVSSRGSYVLGVKWGGTCGTDDGRNVFVRIRSASGAAACGYYQLAARFYFDENEACP